MPDPISINEINNITGNDNSPKFFNPDDIFKLGSQEELKKKKKTVPPVQLGQPVSMDEINNLTSPEFDLSNVDFGDVKPVIPEKNILEINPDFKTVVTKEPLKEDEIKRISPAFDDYEEKRKEQEREDWKNKIEFFGSFIRGIDDPRTAAMEPAWRDIVTEVVLPSITPIGEGYQKQFEGNFLDVIKETFNPLSASNIKKIQGTASTVALPFTLGDYILRQSPGGEPIADIAGAPFWTVDKITEGILEPIKFSSDENYDAELKGLIRTGAQFILPMLVGKLVKSGQLKKGQILEDIAKENPNAIKSALEEVIANPYSGLEDAGQVIGNIIKIPAQERLISREGPKFIPKTSGEKTAHVTALKNAIYEDLKKLKGFYDEVDMGPGELSTRIIDGVENLKEVDLSPEVTTLQNLSKNAPDVQRLIHEYNVALDINRKIGELRDFVNSPNEIPGLEVWRRIEPEPKIEISRKERQGAEKITGDVLGLEKLPASEVYELEGGKYPKFFKEREGEPLNVSRETLGETPASMGASTPFEIGGSRPVNEIDYLRNAVESAKKLTQKEGFRLIDEVVNNKNIFKDKLQSSLEGLKAFGAFIWDGYSKLPEFGNYEGAYGKWDSYNQMTRKAQVDFIDSMRKEIPSKLTREGIINWMQADGDRTVLQNWFDNSTERYKLGYKRALELTPKEVTVANSIKQYYDAMLYEGMEKGLLRSIVENYVTGLYKKKVPTGAGKDLVELANVTATKTLKDNFGYARKKFYKAYFDAEQAGLIPFDKDISTVVALYDKAFNKVVADRKFIQDLTTGVAKDGRPLVVAEGTGNLVVDPNKPNDAVLVKTRGKGIEFKDYRTIENQPALKDWKLTTVTDDGVPVLMKGDLAVHPEIYKRVKNGLGKSALYDFPVWKQFRKLQSAVKQSMLLLPFFHYVQEGTHAIGHTINPFKVRGIDFNDPIVRYATEHELRLYDFNASNNFREGLGFKGAIGRSVPVLKQIGQMSDFLFHEYIPSMKMDLWEHAYKRNLERFSKDIQSGKISENQIAVMTSRQANAAFGNLNYEAMGRNPTLQDFLQGVMLAPDFLEARGRFAGHVAKPFYWREQARAIGLLAITMFTGARILNKMLDDNYHWEEPFAVVVSGRKYRLRSVPEDLWEAYHDPTRFIYNRVSPFMRIIGELGTHTDYRGAYIGYGKTIKNALTSWIPLGMKEVFGEATKDLPETFKLPRNPDMSLIESFTSSIGLHGSKYFTGTEKMISQRYKERFGIGTMPPDAQEKAIIKKQIREKLNEGNEDEAMQLYSKYREAGIDLDENSKKFFDNLKLNPVTYKFKELSRPDQMELISKMNDEEKNYFMQFVSGLKDQTTIEGQLIERSTRRLQQERAKMDAGEKRDEVGADITINKTILYKLQTGEMKPEQIRPLISETYDFDSEFDNTKKNISRSLNEKDFESAKGYVKFLRDLLPMIQDPDVASRYLAYTETITDRIRDLEGTGKQGEITPKQERKQEKLQEKLRRNKYSPVMP